MTVSNGQLANQTTFNDAFLSRTANTSAVGKIDLTEVSTTDLINIQRIINEILAAQGHANQAGTDPSVNQYATNNVISDGSNRKQALEELDAEFDTSSGHDHDGVNSKAINANNLEDKDDLQESLLVFSSDSAFETNKGSSGEEGDIYFNSTDNQVRVHDGSSWNALSGFIDMEREVPTGSINGVNDTFTLSFVPLTNEHIVVFLDGINQNDTEFSVSGTTLTMTTPPANGQSLFVWYVTDGTAEPVSQPAGTEQLIYHEVTSGEESSKQFDMGPTPATASKTLVDIIGGTSQHFGVDFTISGSTFDWDGFGLDGTLNQGDVVRIRFLS